MEASPYSIPVWFTGGRGCASGAWRGSVITNFGPTMPL